MYDKISQFYDLFHNDLTEDIDFVLSLAEKTGGPILELGCGTGRLMVPLVKNNFKIIGLDNSSAMLAIAEQRLSKLVKEKNQLWSLVEADMTSFNINESFALVIIPYNTLMHLSQQKIVKLLTHVHANLHSNSLLFIDTMNPFILEDSDPVEEPLPDRKVGDPVSGEVIQSFSTSYVDRDSQILHLTWIYEIQPLIISNDQFASESENGPISLTMKYYYLYPHQLELIFTETGYKLEALYGDYFGSPFEEDSERMLAIASLTK